MRRFFVVAITVAAFLCACGAISTVSPGQSPGYTDVQDEELGCVNRITEMDYITVMWWHNFKDISGSLETSISLEVGVEVYANRDSLVAGIYRSIWEGYSFTPMQREDVETYGRLDVESGTWVRAMPITFSGLKRGKIYVFSVLAVDGAGNRSDWVTTMTDRGATWVPEEASHRYYVTRR